MTYTQAQPKYEAVQLVAGSGEAFVEAVNLPTNPNYSYAVNADGSVTISNSAFGSLLFEVGDWAISPAYWGAFSGWHGVTPTGHLSNEQFANQYVSI